MNNKIYFTRITVFGDGRTTVEIIPNKGKCRNYESPSDGSLYNLLNNSMVSDIVPFQEHDRFAMEIFPKYSR